MEGTLRILQGKLSDGRRVEELGVMQFINHFDIKLLKIPLIRNLETIVQSGTICQEMLEEVFNREKQPFAVDDPIFGLMMITNPNKCHPKAFSPLYTLFQINDRNDLTPAVKYLLQTTIEAYDMEHRFRSAVEKAKRINMDNFDLTFYTAWTTEYSGIHLQPQIGSIKTPVRDCGWTSMQLLHQFLVVRHPEQRNKPLPTDKWHLGNGMLPPWYDHDDYQIGFAKEYNRPSESALNKISECERTSRHR